MLHHRVSGRVGSSHPLARAGFFALISLSTVMAGCMERRVVHRTHSQGTPVTQSFVANDKIDILLAVDGSQLSAEQQKEVEDSIATLLDELDAKGVNYQIGLVSP